MNDELSEFGKMTAMVRDLKALHDSSTDEGIQHRCKTLMQNFELLKKAPDDAALKAQTLANIKDLERYKAGRK